MLTKLCIEFPSPDGELVGLDVIAVYPNDEALDNVSVP